MIDIITYTLYNNIIYVYVKQNKKLNKIKYFIVSNRFIMCLIILDSDRIDGFIDLTMM